MHCNSCNSSQCIGTKVPLGCKMCLLLTLLCFLDIFVPGFHIHFSLSQICLPHQEQALPGCRAPRWLGSWLPCAPLAPPCQPLPPMLDPFSSLRQESSPVWQHSRRMRLRASTCCIAKTRECPGKRLCWVQAHICS